MPENTGSHGLVDRSRRAVDTWPVSRPALLGATVGLFIAIGGASAAAPSPPDQIAYIGKYQGVPALYLANADGGNRTLIARGVTDHTTFSWSPDGQRLAVTRGGGTSQEVWLVNADGSGLSRLTHSAGKRRHTDFDWSEDASWSPDGTRIAFDGQRAIYDSSPQQIYVIGADGSGESKLTHTAAPSIDPTWAPNGRILFEEWLGHWGTPDPQGIVNWVSNRRLDLYTMNADGSALRRIARVHNEVDHCACPAWSPDGTKIAYEAAEAGGKPDIWVMNADGTGRKQLTHDPARDENPDWSPDGTQIAFYSERTGNGQIWVIGADGSGEHRVTHDRWYDQAVRWRPAG
jgi:Tol biopolymer transport system component